VRHVSRPEDVSTDPVILAARVDGALPDGLASQKRMFGGITFLVKGNMLCCAARKGLMVRVGAEAEAKALESPHAAPCLGAGRRMAGFIMIEPEGLTRDAELKRWLSLARTYVETLPPKLKTLRGSAPKQRQPAKRRTTTKRGKP